MGLSELAKASAMSPSKARRYLISFTRAGFIEQDGATGSYDLGWFALRLGLAAQSRSDVVRLSRALLTKLRAALSETVALVMWVGDRPTVVHIEESDRSIIRLVAPVGGPLQLLTTAGGLIFAAFLPSRISGPLIEQELKDFARHAPRSNLQRAKRDAERKLNEVRKRGIARAYPVISTSICTLAAPIFDAQGTVTAALVAIGYKSNFDARLDGTVATAIKIAALQLSQRLGSGALQFSKTESEGRRGQN